MTAAPVNGHVSRGFEPVADAFADNFRHRGDTAASCVVYAQGAPVVDIWAGQTARGAWTPDARTVVFSVSKGVTTVCVLMAAERGLIDLDAPVAKYWPEFAENGKDATTVRHLLAHRAGLVAPEAELTWEDLRAWHPVADALARQAPAWPPGTAYAYHALTFGWLAGEVLRRATGLRPGQWLREHVAEPLGLTMTFGADPASADLHPLADPLPSTDPEAVAMMAEALAAPMIERSIGLGGLIDVARIAQVANTQAWLSAEIPAGNLVTDARGLARLYAATVGEVDGVRLLGPDIVRDALVVRSEGRPFVGPDVSSGWGTGFMTSSAHRPMIGPGSFGHDGLGGCLGFAHPEYEVAFAYQTAQPGGLPDDRADALSRALRACL
ncbi:MULTISPECIES: serine hydrolase domain-containing protein [Streptomyces]|uniref:Serine hydrolase n=1 Tax=Streptomyces caniscabiei TaxID=2746961 RepID=A0ABU4N4G6_9ACTN|nr:MULTISPECIES: serine hydrolase domain-containing protein [Streptomyces]MBE4741920.1 beta-lactamase family protein [Streptomyces caniscabiei]MBE4759499.1 beta-lactamase family protein [Streptomyces caniscabiei]MBE4773217.1 beta-lactamase family protein [Streptomyces caniscabiei]MBE4790761.1 beta-lactamase family protein [Streptomyces caniscabiei]MBE4797972.1 beta-lactamase family protein [Streptomyces caniscabiei]